jgi:hypothetical protein
MLLTHIKPIGDCGRTGAPARPPQQYSYVLLGLHRYVCVCVYVYVY